MKKEKEVKNNVSYFFAGYKAALERYKIYTKQGIERLDYTSIEFHNEILEELRKYDKE